MNEKTNELDNLNIQSKEDKRTLKNEIRYLKNAKRLLKDRNQSVPMLLNIRENTEFDKDERKAFNKYLYQESKNRRNNEKSVEKHQSKIDEITEKYNLTEGKAQKAEYEKIEDNVNKTGKSEESKYSFLEGQKQGVENKYYLIRIGIYKEILKEYDEKGISDNDPKRGFLENRLQLHKERLIQEGKNESDLKYYTIDDIKSKEEMEYFIKYYGYDEEQSIFGLLPDDDKKELLIRLNDSINRKMEELNANEKVLTIKLNENTNFLDEDNESIVSSNEITVAERENLFSYLLNKFQDTPLYKAASRLVSNLRSKIKNIETKKLETKNDDNVNRSQEDKKLFDERIAINEDIELDLKKIEYMEKANNANIPKEYAEIAYKQNVEFKELLDVYNSKKKQLNTQGKDNNLDDVNINFGR